MGIRRRYLGLRQDALDIFSQYLRASARDYTRFIILGMGRTGSNLLASSLRSHKNIVAFGELFNSSKKNHILWEYPGYVCTARQLSARNRDPAQFIESMVFKPMPKQTMAVGFKLFYYHARDNDWRDIWPYLQASDIKIIHIKRRNLLALQLSMTLALQTKEWSTRERKSLKDDRTCVLPYESCLKAFESVTQWQQDADSYFAGKEIQEIWYEDLNAGYEPTLEKVQRFLKVEPLPSESPLKRQATSPLSEAISNYEELKERFAGSRWEVFFS